VITVHGDGLFSVSPFVVHGKALTIRAAEGGRPRFAVGKLTTTAPWHPLLWTDAEGTVQGIDLDCEPSAPAHLIYSQGAALRLLGCRLCAPALAAPVVYRGARDVEIRDCSLTAQATAVSIELGAGPPPQLVFAGNT